MVNCTCIFTNAFSLDRRRKFIVKWELEPTKYLSGRKERVHICMYVCICTTCVIRNAVRCIVYKIQTSFLRIRGTAVLRVSLSYRGCILHAPYPLSPPVSSFTLSPPSYSLPPARTLPVRPGDWTLLPAGSASDLLNSLCICALSFI